MTLELAVAILAIVVTISGGILSTAIGLFAWFVRRNEKLQDDVLEQLKTKVDALDADVEGLKVAVGRYEPLVGAGKESIEALHAALADHVTKEEQIFWKKIEAVSEVQRIANETLLQRMSTIEAKMPNGELKDLMKAVARIEAAMVGLHADVERVTRHVDTHESESDVWKQRIVALETKSGGRTVARAAAAR